MSIQITLGEAKGIELTYDADRTSWLCTEVMQWTTTHSLTDYVSHSNLHFYIGDTNVEITPDSIEKGHILEML